MVIKLQELFQKVVGEVEHLGQICLFKTFQYFCVYCQQKHQNDFILCAVMGSFDPEYRNIFHRQNKH